MTAIAIAPKHLHPGKKADAPWFQKRAKQFVARWGGSTYIFNNRAKFADRRYEVLRYINARKRKEDVESIAFFVHGYKNGMQCGFYNMHIPALATALKAFPNLHTVCLYACSCAGTVRNGELSFASRLRDATQVYVWAHADAGMTALNPRVIVYEPGYHGGYYPVPRTSKRYGEWKRRLKAGLWMEFPALSPWDVLL